MSKVTPDQRARIRAEYARGGVSQRQLARIHGVSQPMISNILKAEDTVQDVPAPTAPPNLVVLPPLGAEDRLSLTPIQDLESRIRQFDQIAIDATAKGKYDSAVSASRNAARLRRDLDAMREAAGPTADRDESSDDDQLVLLLGAVARFPDIWLDRLEDAIRLRRTGGVPPEDDE